MGKKKQAVIKLFRLAQKLRKMRKDSVGLRRDKKTYKKYKVLRKKLGGGKVA